MNLFTSLITLLIGVTFGIGITFGGISLVIKLLDKLEERDEDGSVQ